MKPIVGINTIPTDVRDALLDAFTKHRKIAEDIMYNDAIKFSRFMDEAARSSSLMASGEVLAYTNVINMLSVGLNK